MLGFDRVSLIKGIIAIRVYEGSGFPQMDSSYLKEFKKKEKQKDLVDPYCIVKYAGQELQTPVRKNKYDPHWNTEIEFGVQVRMHYYYILYRLLLSLYTAYKRTIQW